MLTAEVTRYLTLRRAVGFQFRTHERTLHRFAKYATAKDETHIKTSTVLEWLRLKRSPASRHEGLSQLRGFALAMHAEDNRHEVPQVGLFGKPENRSPVKLFSHKQIICLLDATESLGANTFPHILYETLFGLLAATGLRISEALRLDLIDLTQDGLVIRGTKFQKSRIVPLHESTWHAIKRYLIHRKKRRTLSCRLFINIYGGPLSYGSTNDVFLKLARRAGLRGSTGTKGLTIHGLRHSFAVRSLEGCGGADSTAVQNHIVALGTYLGHVTYTSTQWYLHATPVLTKQAAELGETLFQEKQK
jgi:integrase